MIFEPVIAIPIVVGLVALLWSAVGGFSFRWMFRRGAFGKSGWATWFDLRKNGLTKSGGLFLGRAWFRDLYHNDTEGHVISIGTAGSGKSSGLVVPALLNLKQGSVIVTDPSGELTAMTKRHRATQGAVVFLNPYKALFDRETGFEFEDTGFNPLAVLDPDEPTFKADCDTIARYILVEKRESSDSYWANEATAYLSLMIASIILYYDDDLHNLAFLYQLVRDRPEQVEETLLNIMDSGHPALVNEAEGFLGIVQNAGEQWQGAVRKAATATEKYAPSTPLGDHTKINGFNASDLKTKDVTVYVLVPSAQLANALPWMNLIMGCFGIAIGRPGKARSVTLLIDEAPSLGYLPDLLPWMAQFRKVGLRVWIFSQTVSQLSSRDLYGKDGFEAIFGLCQIKQFFGISEPDTARLVSDLCGEKTARNVSANDSGANVGEVGVPLIRPEAVRGMKKWRQIIIKDGMQKPIRARLVPYFKRRKWRDMTDKNPYR